MMFVSTTAYIYYKVCASDNNTEYITQRNTTCSKNNPLGELAVYMLKLPPHSYVVLTRLHATTLYLCVCFQHFEGNLNNDSGGVTPDQFRFTSLCSTTWSIVLLRRNTAEQ